MADLYITDKKQLERFEELKKIITKALDILYPEWRKDENYKETPKRVANEYLWYFRNEDYKKHIKLFNSKNRDMVTIEGIRVLTLCPHHLLPIELDITVYYIPNEKVLGLSKFSRIARSVGSKPILQEDYTVELKDILVNALKPRYLKVESKGIHGCVRCRGVKEVNQITKVVSEFKNENYSK